MSTQEQAAGSRRSQPHDAWGNLAMTSIESLPTELHEHIFAFLLPRLDCKQLVTPPVSKEDERTDIYNLRLTCRILCSAASRSFVRILEDVPTHCRAESLRNLAALVDLPYVLDNLACLTLFPHALFPNVDFMDRWE
jgi:hypothetical protein